MCNFRNGYNLCHRFDFYDAYPSFDYAVYVSPPGPSLLKTIDFPTSFGVQTLNSEIGTNSLVRHESLSRIYASQSAKTLIYSPPRFLTSISLKRVEAKLVCDMRFTTPDAIRQLAYSPWLT